MSSGLSLTTGVVVRKIGDAFEARAGFALIGVTNMSEEEFEACDYDPFHPDFRDNYCRGVGVTSEEAVEALKSDLSSMVDTLWR